MNLLQNSNITVIEFYTVGVALSLCRRSLLDIVIVNAIVMSLSTIFTQCAQKTTKFGKITQNKGHFTTQGPSR